MTRTRWALFPSRRLIDMIQPANVRTDHRFERVLDRNATEMQDRAATFGEAKNHRPVVQISQREAGPFGTVPETARDQSAATSSRGRPVPGQHLA